MQLGRKHWAPSLQEKLRARTQKVWRCQHHTRETKTCTVPKDRGCDKCNQSAKRRKYVVKWLRERGLIEE